MHPLEGAKCCRTPSSSGMPSIGVGACATGFLCAALAEALCAALSSPALATSASAAALPSAALAFVTQAGGAFIGLGFMSPAGGALTRTRGLAWDKAPLGCGQASFAICEPANIHAAGGLRPFVPQSVGSTGCGAGGEDIGGAANVEAVACIRDGTSTAPSINTNADMRCIEHYETMKSDGGFKHEAA